MLTKLILCVINFNTIWLYSTLCRYEIMHGCWAYDPGQRPIFSTLVGAIAENLAENAEYFTFSVSPTSQGVALIAEDTEEGCNVLSNHSERSASLSDVDSV